MIIPFFTRSTELTRERREKNLNPKKTKTKKSKAAMNKCFLCVLKFKKKSPINQNKFYEESQTLSMKSKELWINLCKDQRPF